MADQKLTDQTQTTTAADTDIVYVVINPGGSPAGRKMTMSDFLRRGHGSISVTGGAAAQVLTGGIEVVTGFTAASGTSVNCTPSFASDIITMDATGTWTVSLFFSFSGTASASFDIHIYYDGSSIGTVSKTLDGSGTEDSVAMTIQNVPVASTATDFDVRVSSGTNTFTVTEAILSVSRVP